MDLATLAFAPILAQAADAGEDIAQQAPRGVDFFGIMLMILGLYIFVLAIVLGYELISKVPPTLHTPLMSGANAISGITVVGALVCVSHAVSTGASFLGFVAIIMATINVVGGFMVTNRMLEMFGPAKKTKPEKKPATQGGDESRKAGETAADKDADAADAKGKADDKDEDARKADADKSKGKATKGKADKPKKADEPGAAKKNEEPDVSAQPDAAEAAKKGEPKPGAEASKKGDSKPDAVASAKDDASSDAASDAASGGDHETSDADKASDSDEPSGKDKKSN